MHQKGLGVLGVGGGESLTACYLPDDLSQRIHINAAPQPPPNPLHTIYKMCSALPERLSINPYGPLVNTDDFCARYLCAPSANRAGYIFKAVGRNLLISFLKAVLYCQCYRGQGFFFHFPCSKERLLFKTFLLM